jgi:pilus assembly protein CpaE
MSNAHTGDKPGFLAFVSDGQDMAELKTFAAAHLWSDNCVHQGDIRTASQYLKSNPSPILLLVELPSAKDAPAMLDELADVCDPDTKVITIGNINEYSFYCWLMDLGIFSYLLRPLTQAMLESAHAKSVEPVSSGGKHEKPPGKIITVSGTRGGVGASTIAINLAGAIADLSKKNVALVDVDPQEGSIALTLDIEPSRGFRDVLEKPDRIDSLFMERVMNKVNKNLSVLSAEEALHDNIRVHDQAAEALLKELRNQYDVVVLDVPRFLSTFNRACLKQAEHVVMVTDLSLLALRDMLRVGDVMRETLKIKPSVIVANRIGMVPKHEMPVADFEKGANSKIACRVPFAPDIYMQISNDIPAVKQKTHAAVKPLHALAVQLVPEARAKPSLKEKNKKAGFDLNLFKKKEV